MDEDEDDIFEGGVQDKASPTSSNRTARFKMDSVASKKQFFQAKNPNQNKNLEWLDEVSFKPCSK